MMVHFQKLTPLDEEAAAPPLLVICVCLVGIIELKQSLTKIFSTKSKTNAAPPSCSFALAHVVSTQKQKLHNIVSSWKYENCGIEVNNY